MKQKIKIILVFLGILCYLASIFTIGYFIGSKTFFSKVKYIYINSTCSPCECKPAICQPIPECPECKPKIEKVLVENTKCEEKQSQYIKAYADCQKELINLNMISNDECYNLLIGCNETLISYTNRLDNISYYVDYYANKNR